MIKYSITGWLFCATLLINSYWTESAEDKFYGRSAPAQESSQTILLADPTVFLDNDTFYLYGTHKVNEGFEVYSSTDLEKWKKAPALALSKDDVYGDKGFWAPQVFKVHQTYYMAYTANEHIAVAQSESPRGPFRQKLKKPFQTGVRAIDPFVFIDDDGKKYLYFVRLEEGNRLFVAALKDDFSDIVPGTTRPCLNGADEPQRWENTASADWTVTEGPTVLKHLGKYYLFYSGNDFRNVDYAVGYAVSDSPFGPWKKSTVNPILTKDMLGQNGPGHGDFFRDSTSQYYYVFHTHFADTSVMPRKTAIIKGSFKAGDDGPERMEFDKASFYYIHSR